MIDSSRTINGSGDDDLLERVDSLIAALSSDFAESSIESLGCHLEALNNMHSNVSILELVWIQASTANGYQQLTNKLHPQIPWNKLLSGMEYREDSGGEITLMEPAYFERLNDLVGQNDRR